MSHRGQGKENPVKTHCVPSYGYRVGIFSLGTARPVDDAEQSIGVLQEGGQVWISFSSYLKDFLYILD